jgi:glutaredoxin
MHFSCFISAIGLILLTASVSAAELYKWVDNKGNTHYTDSPPPNSATEQNIAQLPDLNGYAAAETEPSTASNNTALATPEVIMYGTPWCGYCKKARRYFQHNKIAFREYDIESSSSAHRRFKQLGGNGVPLIVIGKKKMSGFSVARFKSLYQR